VTFRGVLSWVARRRRGIAALSLDEGLDSFSCEGFSEAVRVSFCGDPSAHDVIGDRPSWWPVFWA
jgi:hypothetical protein